MSGEGVLNDAESQKGIIAGAAAIGLTTSQVGDVIKARLKLVGTKIFFQLKPIEGGPFESDL